MKNLTFIEWLIVAAIVAILALVVLGPNSKAQFRKACDEAKGVTVFDGRQYQCIKGSQ